MIDIPIKYWIKLKSWNEVKKYNFGKRGYADGNQEEQYTGILGQNVICDYYDQPMASGKDGFDGGVDLCLKGKRIDVKTMGRKGPVRTGYTNNFLAAQDGYNTDIYLFCSINKTDSILTICGWVTQEQFKNRRVFHKQGSIRIRRDGTAIKVKSDLYEIDNDMLNPISKNLPN
tara:strand:- start:890 stop:1408 length:519 start_codon:yes stop_codon:yes gene_type:complete